MREQPIAAMAIRNSIRSRGGTGLLAVQQRLGSGGIDDSAAIDFKGETASLIVIVITLREIAHSLFR
jgi:hypothetical protein